MHGQEHGGWPERVGEWMRDGLIPTIHPCGGRSYVVSWKIRFELASTNLAVRGCGLARRIDKAEPRDASLGPRSKV